MVEVDSSENIKDSQRDTLDIPKSDQEIYDSEASDDEGG